ncbi:MAG: glycosyltransferase family 39 protein [Chloroflexi bacterium]|nr:glycosyltransferase family 39 protein [Chloroflexota bacterium]
MKFLVLSHLVSYNLSALEFVRPQPLSRFETFFLLAVHALGLFALAQLTRVSPLWILLILAVFVAAQFLPHTRAIFTPALLAPFWFVYAAIALRFVFIRFARGDVPGYFEYALPDARVLLHFEMFVAAALCYAGLILFALWSNSRARAVVCVSVVGVIVALAWASAEYFGHRTFGAIGSDPYAYVQMGVDLITRGNPSHPFRLLPSISSTALSWFPILHVGYHLPFNAQGDAIAVWSPGGAVAFAIAYALGGESALYLVNPVFSIAGALAAALLAWELTRRETRTQRIVTACVVCALMLTSYEIVNWAGVTMVDTQALMFSTLAMYCALRVYRTGSWQWALAIGVAWGVAYQVRHTQVVIALGFVPLLLLAPFPAKKRARNIALVGAAALTVALPDLWYHHVYLGSWLTPESEELALFSLGAMAPTLLAIGQRALVGAEFGWLSIFVSAGIVLYARRARVENSAMLLWLAAALAIHLPYAALRLRDLIPEFPVLAFYIAFGIVSVVPLLWARPSAWTKLTAACIIFLALELSLARVWNTLPRVLEPAPMRFGAMTRAQRASFDEIARVTPEDAVVGASLNSGAIDLYAHRAAFRPADWSNQELETFVAVTQGEKRAIYLLEDNGSLAPVLNALRNPYRLERVTTLDVPLFGDEAVENPGALWKIVEIRN